MHRCCSECVKRPLEIQGKCKNPSFHAETLLPSSLPTFLFCDTQRCTSPRLVKKLNPSATPLLPNNTKEEMPMRGRLPSPSTTASLSRSFPQALGMGHGWKQEPEVIQSGRLCPTCHENWLQDEEAVTATDMEKTPKQTLKNACAHALLID
ncbi:hypothetical protein AV530_010817 [Patagioenas fasciata monilis]|uniref:Uncharacterized protein n=1 Tax=Patagioenas fasciata monilis TaxID=372326 RepID=A0A1V4K7W5_PATFA|nr:hypothetical protein AV530_010817 [Patagioenas fasciata monilis]